MASGAIVGTASPNGVGAWTYSYEVDNMGAYPIIGFSLNFDFIQSEANWNPLDTLAGGDVTVPAGAPMVLFDDWEARGNSNPDQQARQDFFAVGPAGQGDVLPTERVGGFSFVSRFAPTEVEFTEFGPNGESQQGLVVGPSAIPEPSALLLIFLGAGTLCARRSRLISVSPKS